MVFNFSFCGDIVGNKDTEVISERTNEYNDDLGIDTMKTE